MRRYISLACVALIFVMCMVSPVSAEEINNNQLMDLLDYCVPDGYSDNAFNFASGSSLTYTLPVANVCYYVDMVIRSSSAFSSLTVSNGNSSVSLPLTVEKISGDLYRAFGNLSGYYFQKLVITFNFSSASGYGQVYALNVGFARSSHYDIEAYCEIAATDYSNTIYYVPTDDINYRMFTATDDYLDNWFNCYIWTDDWAKYDFIDFQLMFDCFEITSVTAVMGSTNIPLDVSYFDGTNIDGNHMFVSMRMDVTGLDRTSSDHPMITIMGRLNAGALNSVDFVNCSGYVLLNTTNPLTYYFNKIETWLGNLGSTINSFVGNQFTQLYYWINNQTNSIVSAIRGDTSSGDSFQQEVEDKDQQLNDMAAVMDSVERPELDLVNVSADSYIDTTVLASSTAGLTAVISSPVFLDVIMMSLIMATCGYVLFGKR